MQTRDGYIEKIENILKYYKTGYFAAEELVSLLEQIPEYSDRFNLLTEIVPRYGKEIFLIFFQYFIDSAKDLVSYFTRILALLNSENKKELVNRSLYSLFHHTMIYVLTSEKLSETEREEATEMMCTLLKNNLTTKEQQTFSHEKTYGGKTYFDYAKTTGNQNVLKTIYAFTYGKEMNSTGCLSCCPSLFSAKNPQQRLYFTSRILHSSMNENERDQAIERGKMLRNDILERRNQVMVFCAADVTQPTNLSFMTQILLQLNEVYMNNHDEDYAIRCLSTSIGLYALGSGLLTFEEAKTYARNETLEYILSGDNVPFLRLFNALQLAALKPSYFRYLKGEYAFFALEGQLITAEQLCSIGMLQEDVLSVLFTYYGMIALREKLISFEDALQFKTQDIFLTKLEALLTENGITALREKLYTVTDVLSMSSNDLDAKLKLAALQQRRQECARALRSFGT